MKKKKKKNILAKKVLEAKKIANERQGERVTEYCKGKLQVIVNKFGRSCNEINLIINVKKSTVVVLSKKLNKEGMEKVDNYKYHWVIKSADVRIMG